MQKFSLAILVALTAVAGAAQAQESTHINTITDPARISEIEQHGQELQAHQEAAPVAAEHHEQHHVVSKHHHHHAVKK